MLDYLIIGLIVGLILTVDNLLSHGHFTKDEIGEWAFWLGALVAWMINTLLWPVMSIDKLMQMTSSD